MVRKALIGGMLALLVGGLAFADTVAQREELLNKQIEEITRKFSNGRGGVDGSKMGEKDQNEYLKLQAELESVKLWKQARIPAALDLAKLPAIPRELLGTGDGPAKDSIELSSGDAWRLMGLTSQCMVALPRGWQVIETPYETMVQFPVEMGGGAGGAPAGGTAGASVEINAEDLVQIKFSLRGTRDFDGYYQSFTGQLKRAFGSQGIDVGPKIPLAGGGGSFATRTQSGQRVSITVFIPAKDKSEKAYQCLVSASGERWKALGPVFEAMATHWYDHAGRALAEGYKFDQSITPRAATSQPATTRGN